MGLSIKTLDIPRSINTSDYNVSKDFFIPLLSHSIKYDRGVGYFTSGWLKINCKGMIAFANAGGKARWIVSPILKEEDWKAIKLGNDAKQDILLRMALEREIQNLKLALEKNVLGALAWMIADQIVEFRIATLRGSLGGEFHDKFGIFQDSEGHAMSFNGSNNETAKGFTNYESFKVFCSWDEGLKGFVEEDQARFERIWNNQDQNVRVVDPGNALREQMIQLRTEERPYQRLSWTLEEPQRPTYAKAFKARIPPEITLWDHQSQAVEAWIENNYQGFLEMATGSGKTTTSLVALVHLFEQKKKLAVIISVPYQHLVEQWRKELSVFRLYPIQAFRQKNDWIDELNEQIMEFNQGLRQIISVITTHTTFSKKHFQASIDRIKGPSLIIADEAHHLGAKSARSAYPWKVRHRLALSATPNRWFDEMGTKALKDYFGPTVFEFTLKEAIGVSLTEYYFIPVLVELTAAELEEYKNISTQLAQIYGRAQKDLSFQDRLSTLLRNRANLLNKAQNKLSLLSQLIDQHPVNQHTLFYCAPGQIDEVVSLLGREKGVLLHKFTNEENSERRKKLLEQFETGELDALAAIKCLDEGVDVPSTQRAYLLASSSNPREFIQRRGRILRKAPGKKFATLYDLITVPPAA